MVSESIFDELERAAENAQDQGINFQEWLRACLRAWFAVLVTADDDDEEEVPVS